MKKYYFWSALDQIIVSGGNFLTIFIAAFYLSLNDQGNFIILLSFYFFSLIMSISLVYSPMQAIYPKTKDKYDYIYTSFLYHILLSLVFVAVSLLATKAMNSFGLIKIPTTTAFYFSIFIFLQQLSDYARRSSYVFINAFVAFCFSAFLYISRISLLLISDIHLLNDVIILLIYTSAFGAFIILSYVIYKKLKYKLQFNRTILNQHISFSKHLAYSAPIGWSIAYMPTLLLGLVSGPVLAGVLGTMRSLTGIANSFVEVIEVSVIAHLSKSHHTNKSAHIKTTFQILIFIFIVFWIIIFGLASEFYNTVISYFNKEFIAYSSILMLLWLAYLFYFLGRIHILYCRLLSITEAEFYNSIVSLITVVMFLPLIFFFEIKGAAIVYILSALFGALFTLKKYIYTINKNPAGTI